MATTTAPRPKTQTSAYAAALAALRDAETRYTAAVDRAEALERDVRRAEQKEQAMEVHPMTRRAAYDQRHSALLDLRRKLAEAEAARDGASVQVDQAGQAAAAALRDERWPAYRAAAGRFAEALAALKSAVDDLDTARLAAPPAAAGRTWSIGFPTVFGFGRLDERLQTILRALNLDNYRRWLAARGLLDDEVTR